MKHFFICLFLFDLPSLTTAQSQEWMGAEGYRIETIPNPPTKTFHVTGLDIDANGRVFCATRGGEVWFRHGTNWTLFAEGLHEPCGLVCEPQGSVLVSQKPEVTRLVDEDKNGTAGLYEVVADTFECHDNYHEYNHGLVRDSKGNVYGALNLDHDDAASFNMSGLGSKGGLRGTFYQISPAGDYKTFAWGARSPAGLGMSPNDELFFTDNQGNWVVHLILTKELKAADTAKLGNPHVYYTVVNRTH